MSGNSILIQGGRILDPSQKIDMVGDLLVREGKVESIAPKISLPTEAGIPILSLNGEYVSPGWVDIHTHLREPGGSHKETIATGSMAAAAGGFSTIACMANTNPVNDSAFITTYIYQKVSSESPINVHAIGAVSKGLKGEELAEIGLMWEAGIVGISDDGKTVMNAYLMRKAMDYSKKFDLVVISHAEDAHLKGKGVMNEGFNSARFGLRGIPRAAEEIIVGRDIMLAELTGARLHITHCSTAGTVALIREAKRRGVRVTADVTPHHLTLTDEAVRTYDTNTKVAPPLREPQDIEALLEALSDGTVDALATDHAPHTVEDKEVEYDHAEFGMVGLETAFPLYLEAAQKKGISMSRLISAMTSEPSKIVGLSKGTLKKGSDADITIFDQTTRYRIDKNRFRSKSRNTPFQGREVQGKVIYTLVRGRVVYSSSEKESQ